MIKCKLKKEKKVRLGWTKKIEKTKKVRRKIIG